MRQQLRDSTGPSPEAYTSRNQLDEGAANGSPYVYELLSDPDEQVRQVALMHANPAGVTGDGKQRSVDAARRAMPWLLGVLRDAGPTDQMRRPPPDPAPIRRSQILLADLQVRALPLLAALRPDGVTAIYQLMSDPSPAARDLATVWVSQRSADGDDLPGRRAALTAALPFLAEAVAHHDRYGPPRGYTEVIARTRPTIDQLRRLSTLTDDPSLMRAVADQTWGGTPADRADRLFELAAIAGPHVRVAMARMVPPRTAGGPDVVARELASPDPKRRRLAVLVEAYDGDRPTPALLDAVLAVPEDGDRDVAVAVGRWLRRWSTADVPALARAAVFGPPGDAAASRERLRRMAVGADDPSARSSIRPALSTLGPVSRREALRTMLAHNGANNADVMEAGPLNDPAPPTMPWAAAPAATVGPPAVTGPAAGQWALLAATGAVVLLVGGVAVMAGVVRD